MDGVIAAQGVLRGEIAGVAGQWFVDRDCALTAMSMVTAFSSGDLTGGIVDGVQKLAEHARQPRTLHLDSP